jgi:hypothetical protein
MSLVANLERVREKVLWAAENFKALERVFEEYFKTNPAEIVSEPEASTNSTFLSINAKGSPPHAISYIAGDCIQNVRSALDYLVRELVLAANNKPTDHEIFPICEKAKGFKDACRRGQLDRIPIDARALIEWMQPYNRGEKWKNSVLWILNELANTNKHRRLLVTDLRAAEINLTLRPDKSGGIVANLRAPTLTLPSFKRNAKFRNFPVVNVIPGQEVQMDRKIIVCVTFDEGPVQGCEVSETLNLLMAHILGDVLPLFEPYFPDAT